MFSGLINPFSAYSSFLLQLLASRVDFRRSCRLNQPTIRIQPEHLTERLPKNRIGTLQRRSPGFIAAEVGRRYLGLRVEVKCSSLKCIEIILLHKRCSTTAGCLSCFIEGHSQEDFPHKFRLNTKTLDWSVFKLQVSSWK